MGEASSAPPQQVTPAGAAAPAPLGTGSEEYLRTLERV